MLRGEIAAKVTDRKHLESMGIKLGKYDEEKLEFTNCEVSDEAFVRLNKYWGEYYWTLRKYKSTEVNESGLEKMQDGDRCDMPCIVCDMPCIVCEGHETHKKTAGEWFCQNCGAWNLVYNKPYSGEEYEEAKQRGLDLDNWSDYVKYYDERASKNLNTTIKGEEE